MAGPVRVGPCTAGMAGGGEVSGCLLHGKGILDSVTNSNSGIIFATGDQLINEYEVLSQRHLMCLAIYSLRISLILVCI